jgi:hypothetical protein
MRDEDDGALGSESRQQQVDDLGLQRGIETCSELIGNHQARLGQ